MVLNGQPNASWRLQLAGRCALNRGREGIDLFDPVVGDELGPTVAVPVPRVETSSGVLPPGGTAATERAGNGHRNQCDRQHQNDDHQDRAFTAHDQQNLTGGCEDDADGDDNVT